MVSTSNKDINTIAYILKNSKNVRNFFTYHPGHRLIFMYAIFLACKLEIL